MVSQAELIQYYKFSLGGSIDSVADHKHAVYRDLLHINVISGPSVLILALLMAAWFFHISAKMEICPVKCCH
jgi:hypothetical protein